MSKINQESKFITNQMKKNKKLNYSDLGGIGRGRLGEGQRAGEGGWESWLVMVRA